MEAPQGGKAVVVASGIKFHLNPTSVHKAALDKEVASVGKEVPSVDRVAMGCKVDSVDKADVVVAKAELLVKVAGDWQRCWMRAMCDNADDLEVRTRKNAQHCG